MLQQDRLGQDPVPDLLGAEGEVRGGGLQGPRSVVRRHRRGPSEGLPLRGLGVVAERLRDAVRRDSVVWRPLPEGGGQGAHQGAQEGGAQGQEGAQGLSGGSGRSGGSPSGGTAEEGGSRHRGPPSLQPPTGRLHQPGGSLLLLRPGRDDAGADPEHEPDHRLHPEGGQAADGGGAGERGAGGLQGGGGALGVENHKTHKKDKTPQNPPVPLEQGKPTKKTKKVFFYVHPARILLESQHPSVLKKN